jgi:hypothetical protein
VLATVFLLIARARNIPVPGGAASVKYVAAPSVSLYLLAQSGGSFTKYLIKTKHYDVFVCVYIDVVLDYSAMNWAQSLYLSLQLPESLFKMTAPAGRAGSPDALHPWGNENLIPASTRLPGIVCRHRHTYNL